MDNANTVKVYNLTKFDSHILQNRENMLQSWEILQTFVGAAGEGKFMFPPNRAHKRLYNFQPLRWYNLAIVKDKTFILGYFTNFKKVLFLAVSTDFGYMANIKR